MPSLSPPQHERRFEQRRLGAVDVAHELADAALVVHHLGLLVGVAVVLQHDRTPEFRKASSRRRCSSVA